MKTDLTLRIAYFISVLIFFGSCSGNENRQKDSSSGGIERKIAEDSDDPMKNKGIGPVKSIALGPLDEDMAKEGEKIYQEKCTACHKPEEKFIGPAPKGIVNRRTPEWIMNIILNPEEMIQKDPIARQLLVEYNLAPMANQHLTEKEARNILEYFRTLN